MFAASLPLPRGGTLSFLLQCGFSVCYPQFSYPLRMRAWLVAPANPSTDRNLKGWSGFSLLYVLWFLFPGARCFSSSVSL